MLKKSRKNSENKEKIELKSKNVEIHIWKKSKNREKR